MAYKADAWILLISDEIKVRREWIPRIKGFQTTCMQVGGSPRRRRGNGFGNVQGVALVEDEGIDLPILGRIRICRRRRPVKSDVGNSRDFAPKGGIRFRSEERRVVKEW